MKKKYFIIIINIVIFTLFGIYLYKNAGLFYELKNLSLGIILVLVFLQFLSIYIVGLIQYVIFKRIHLPIKEFYSLQVATNFLNKFTPRGGAVFKGVYLKKKYQISYTSFISIFLGCHIITFLTMIILLLVLILYKFLCYGRFNLTLSLLLLGLLLPFAIVMKINIKNKLHFKIFYYLDQVLTGWNIIRKDKKMLFQVSLLILTSVLVESVRYYLALLAINVAITGEQAVFIAVISILSFYINITPDGLGIREGLFLIFGSEIAYPDFTVMASLILRAVTYVVIVIIGPISILYLNRKLKKPE